MKDWLVKSFSDHPAYTIAFGLVCFAIGFVI